MVTLAAAATGLALAPSGRKMYAPEARNSSWLLFPLIPAYHRYVWFTFGKEKFD